MGRLAAGKSPTSLTRTTGPLRPSQTAAGDGRGLVERFQEPALGREVGRDRRKRISVPREHGEGSAESE